MIIRQWREHKENWGKCRGTFIVRIEVNSSRTWNNALFYPPTRVTERISNRARMPPDHYERKVKPDANPKQTRYESLTRADVLVMGTAYVETVRETGKVMMFFAQKNSPRNHSDSSKNLMRSSAARLSCCSCPFRMPFSSINFMFFFFQYVMECTTCRWWSWSCFSMDSCWAHEKNKNITYKDTSFIRKSGNRRCLNVPSVVQPAFSAPRSLYDIR